MPEQRFKALLFDFDDTLVPEYEVADAGLREIATEAVGDEQTGQELEAALRRVAGELVDGHPAGQAAAQYFGREASTWYAYELMWADKSPLHDIMRHVDSFRAEVWSEALSQSGLSSMASPGSLAGMLPARVEERSVPYPEVQPLLESLAPSYGMAIVTNGEPEVQARKVANSGLERYFDHVILAHEHGGKPRPEPFEVAIERLGREPHEVAMIGNSIANDIAGARNSGIYSIWINRGAGWNETPAAEEHMPDATITRLADLLSAI